MYDREDKTANVRTVDMDFILLGKMVIIILNRSLWREIMDVS